MEGGRGATIGTSGGYFDAHDQFCAVTPDILTGARSSDPPPPHRPTNHKAPRLDASNDVIISSCQLLSPSAHTPEINPMQNAGLGGLLLLNSALIPQRK